MVILSGRPTSLAPIRNVFLKYWGGQPDRLVVLNKHRVGRWYPFADEFGYLTNSKSVVPVGAMIGYLASTAGGMNGFSLDLSALAQGVGPTTDYFSFFSSASRFFRSRSCTSRTTSFSVVPLISSSSFSFQGKWMWGATFSKKWGRWVALSST